MKMEFLESFKKFFFNSGNNEPVRETPDHKEIKEEVGVATDSFDPYYEEMCVNKSVPMPEWFLPAIRTSISLQKT